MSLTLERFPNETILMIFLYLTVSDIHTCQLVCQRFNTIIGSSTRLQFLVELDLCGYVEAYNSPTDILLEEKLEVLRLHRLRRWSNTISRIDTIQMISATDHTPRCLPSRERNPSLKDGALTQWSCTHGDSHVGTMRLNIVQLPSLNTGSNLKRWTLAEKDMNIQGYDTEPACDLLVLLECTGKSININCNIRDQWALARLDFIGFGQGTSQRFLFHFRTLSTNEGHPTAFQPVLDCGLRTTSVLGFPLCSLGDLIIARPGYTRQRYWESGLIIYNWVTGALLDKRDVPYPNSLVVLSNEILVIPRSTCAYDSQDQAMGKLDLYHIDWFEPSGPSLSCVAVLELPVLRSVPPRPRRANSIPQQWAPEADNPMSFAVQCTCCFAPGFQSGQPTSYSSGRPRVFAPSQSNQLLRVHLKLGEIEANGFSRGNLPSAQDTSLYIPFQVIFDTVKFARGDSSPRRIQWDRWGHHARWIHLPFDFWEQPLRAPAGARCALTRHSVLHRATVSFDPNKRHKFDLLLLDFNPEFVKQVRRNANKRGSEPGGEPNSWVQQPAENNYMSPVLPYVDQKQSWLAECTASIAVAPYVWQKLRHEYFSNIVAQLQNWIIVMDIEHIVVVEFEAGAAGGVGKIVAFTF